MNAVIPETSPRRREEETSTSQFQINITALKDLPKGGRVVHVQKEGVSVHAETLSKVAVWGLGSTSSDIIGSRPVWLVTTAAFVQDIKFSNFRNSLKKAKFKVEKIALAADVGLVRAINEAQPQGNESTIENKNELTDFYEEMVAYALREKVSDLHLEVGKASALIRARTNGLLMDYREISAKFGTDLTSVIYNVLAEAKEVSFDTRNYQSAALNSRIEGEEVKLRFQSLPTYGEGCFDAVLRVLPLGDEDEGTPDLSVLGYEPSQCKEIQRIIAKPVGALVIAGTTGSGKSTTLKNLLMLINESRNYRCKIYSIEDPPEYRIFRVSQIPVLPKKASDGDRSPFYAPLVSVMRADPDIIMLGEIRDQYTGDSLKKITQSGHQTLSTVHAATGLGIIERLSDFGIPPSVMGSPEFLNGLVYQKLMPVLCPKCSVRFSDHIASSRVTAMDLELADRMRDVVNLEIHDVRIASAQGCDKCKNTGIVGRTVCAEVIAPDIKMLRLFRQQAYLEAKMYWRSLSDNNPDSDNMNGKPALEHALLKMRRGHVSPYDIENMLGPVNQSHRDLLEMQQDQGSAESKAGFSLAGMVNGLSPAPSSWDQGYKL